jgi:CMP-N-acetylneuraminic acid synthetase
VTDWRASTIAIIPAKGQSERLPRKNLQRVGGVTLLERAMRRAPRGVEVVVATDSDEIASAAELAVQRGGGRLRVVRLDADLVAKRAHLEPVIAAVLRAVPASSSRDVVVLQPTSALCRSHTVDGALAMLRKTGCDSVVSLTESSKEVYFGGAYDWRTDRWTPRRPDGERLFTTELPGNFHENGAVYAFTRAHFERTGSRMGGDMRAVTMPASESIDIDTPEELHRAQLLCGDMLCPHCGKPAVAEVT